MSYGIINHLRLLSQDQAFGLQPDGGTYQNCIHLISSDRYYFNDEVCEAPFAALCEAPLEALSDGPVQTIFY